MLSLKVITTETSSIDWSKTPMLIQHKTERIYGIALRWPTNDTCTIVIIGTDSAVEYSLDEAGQLGQSDMFQSDFIPFVGKLELMNAPLPLEPHASTIRVNGNVVYHIYQPNRFLSDNMLITYSRNVVLITERTEIQLKGIVVGVVGNPSIEEQFEPLSFGFPVKIDLRANRDKVSPFTSVCQIESLGLV